MESSTKTMKMELVWTWTDMRVRPASDPDTEISC